MDIPEACKIRLCMIVLEIANEKSAERSKVMRSVADESHTNSSRRKDMCDEKH